MAVIQYTGLVSEIQGALQGSVLSRGRSGAVFYKKPVQRREPTQSQLAVRQGFKSAGRTWKELTLEQQEDWRTIADANPVPNRFGELYNLPAYQYYQRMSGLRFPAGNESPIIPDLSDTPAYEFEPETITGAWTLTDAGYVIDSLEPIAETISDSGAINFFNVYISLPVSDPSRPYFGHWYLVGQVEVPANEGASVSVDLSLSDVLMPSGWYTFAGSSHLVMAQAFVADQGTVSVRQIWSVELSDEPVVEIPVFTIYTCTSFEALCTKYGYGSASQDNSFFIMGNFTDGDQELSLYMANIQWAASQPTQAPVDEGDWGSLINVGLLGELGPSVMAPSVPNFESFWKGPYDSEFSGSVDSPAGWWVPIRVRLVAVSDGTQGPWVNSFAPVVSNL